MVGDILPVACVAGGMRERASGGGAAITASQPKQMHSRAKSRQLRRLYFRSRAVFKTLNHWQSELGNQTNRLYPNYYKSNEKCEVYSGA